MFERLKQNDEMLFINERPKFYDEINNLYLRSDFEDEECEPALWAYYKACGYVGNRPSDCTDKFHEDDTWAIDRYDEDGTDVMVSYIYSSESEYLEDCKILGLL